MNASLSLTVGLSIFLGSTFALAQQSTQPQMTFFVTSIGIGKGGDLGGLLGADAHCQRLAAAAGAGGRVWHAYLSTQSRGGGSPAASARDRIGQGPWYNAKGEMIAKGLADLHGDTLELARVGNNLTKLTALSEKGAIIPGLNDAANRHDILTGSRPDGRAYVDDADHTCGNWTSSVDGASAQAGLSDRNGWGNGSWNSAHPTSGCSQGALERSQGVGLFYCFAVN
jgi:hypothetical protein